MGHIAKPLKSTKPQIPEEEVKEEEWEEIRTNEPAFKVNPGDDLTVILLDEPKLVKQNQASVVHVKVLEWNTHPDFRNTEKLIMLQKIPTDTILTNIQNGKIKIGKTAVRLINQGKLPGTRYYSYKIMIKNS